MNLFYYLLVRREPLELLDIWRLHRPPATVIAKYSIPRFQKGLTIINLLAIRNDENCLWNILRYRIDSK